MSQGFRQSMSGLHSWSGLLVGWLMFAIAITGTATVFKPEISGWMRPEVTDTAPPAKAIESAVGWLARMHPRGEGWYLTAPDDRIATTGAVFDDSAAPSGYRTIALDPVTGSPAAIRETPGGEFFYRFHFELQLPYPWGRILASAVAMLMLIALISGIVIHARIFKDFFTLRPGKGKRSWLDAHNVLGVLALPFHLMIMATGIVTLLTLTMPWGVAANYGNDRSRAFTEISPGLISRAPAGKPAPLAPIAPMLAEAMRRFGGGRIGQVSIAHPGDRNSVVTVMRHDGDQLAYAAGTVSFAGATGVVIGSYAETRPARRTYDVLYGLHMGRFAPWVSRWLYFLCGLALTGTIATGLILWIEARKGAAGFGHRLVARLNVGTIAGLPIAMLAFLWGNRLLPIGLAERGAAEVRVFFWAWGAAMLFAFVRPVRRAWIEMFGLAAAGAGLLPFVSFLLTGRGLWAAAIGGDRLFLGFDLMLFALALAFATIARRVSAYRVPPPRQRRTVPA